MNITFDSNVWERLIDEEEHHLVKIKNKIRDGKIQAYICEIALSLEAIQRKLRYEFSEDYEPSITVEHLPPENGEFRMRFCIAPNTDLHPGLHPKQLVKLLKARDIGFRVLRMINSGGTVRTKDIPDDMYVQHDDMEEYWRYAELLENCSDFIIGLGCGRAAYDQFNLVGLDSQTVPNEQKQKFSEAIAEWVDSEALSAHYAARNDFFCTDDKAGNAGTGSIFHNQNRTQLIKKFGIKIISSREAAQLC